MLWKCEDMFTKRFITYVNDCTYSMLSLYVSPAVMSFKCSRVEMIDSSIINTYVRCKSIVAAFAGGIGWRVKCWNIPFDWELIWPIWCQNNQNVAYVWLLMVKVAEALLMRGSHTVSRVIQCKHWLGSRKMQMSKKEANLTVLYYRSGNIICFERNKKQQ